MKKFEIIKTIVEAAQENENMIKYVFGETIVTASKEAYKENPNIKELKPLLESALYLIEQIEKCQAEVLSSVSSNQDPHDYIRLENKYTESLKKCLNQI